ncbi:hypothetical protein AAC387_Pa04g2250 [Persea americana]
MGHGYHTQFDVRVLGLDDNPLGFQLGEDERCCRPEQTAFGVPLESNPRKATKIRTRRNVATCCKVLATSLRIITISEVTKQAFTKPHRSFRETSGRLR